VNKSLVRSFLFIFFVSQTTNVYADIIKDAQEKYKSGDYKTAYEYYKKAQVDNPQNNVLKYNMANSAYKSGKYTEAEQSFKSLSSSEISNELKSKALYNLGNTYYKQAKLQDAEKSYLDSLKLNKDDLSAKKNLEKVREEINKKEKEEKQRKQNQDKNNKKQKDKDKSKDKEKDKNGKDNDGKGKDNPSNPDNQNKNNDKPNQEKNKGSQFKENPKNGMTSKEAEKWLDSIKDDSKEVIKRQIRKKSVQNYNSGKDW